MYQFPVYRLNFFAAQYQKLHMTGTITTWRFLRTNFIDDLCPCRALLCGSDIKNSEANNLIKCKMRLLSHSGLHHQMEMKKRLTDFNIDSNWMIPENKEEKEGAIQKKRRSQNGIIEVFDIKTASRVAQIRISKLNAMG